MKSITAYEAFDKWTHSEDLNERELFLILTHDWTDDVDYFDDGGFLMTYTQYLNMKYIYCITYILS